MPCDLPGCGQCNRTVAHKHRLKKLKKVLVSCLGLAESSVNKQINTQMLYQQEEFELQPRSKFSEAQRMALMMPSSQKAQIDHTPRISLAHKCGGYACFKVFSLSNEGNFFKLSQKACPGNGMCFYRNELFLYALQEFNTHNGRLISR